MDAVDRKILDILQQDATLPVAELAERVGVSAAPCWRRVKKLEASGVIRRRVALVDRRKVNVPTTVFVAVKAPRHAADWSDAFRRVVAGFPEIVEAWRLTGERRPFPATDPRFGLPKRDDLAFVVLEKPL